MTWLDLEIDWLRSERNSYFAPEDIEGIALFEAHLRTHRIPYTKQHMPDVPAVVFSPASVTSDIALAA